MMCKLCGVVGAARVVVVVVVGVASVAKAGAVLPALFRPLPRSTRCNGTVVVRWASNMHGVATCMR